MRLSSFGNPLSIKKIVSILIAGITIHFLLTFTLTLFFQDNEIFQDKETQNREIRQHEK